MFRPSNRKFHYLQFSFYYWANISDAVVIHSCIHYNIADTLESTATEKPPAS